MITEDEVYDVEKYYKNNPKEMKVKTMHDKDLKKLDKTIEKLKDKGVIIDD